MNVSHAARLHGIQPSQLFKWKKQYQEGSPTAVAAGEEAVPASELTAALKQVRELQRLLGKKTMEIPHSMAAPKFFMLSIMNRKVGLYSLARSLVYLSDNCLNSRNVICIVDTFFILSFSNELFLCELTVFSLILSREAACLLLIPRHNILITRISLKVRKLPLVM